MSTWNMLDILPTGDLSLIKRAYAKKLRLHHPEDDPEGYQRLREAYDEAIKQAKRLNDQACNDLLSEDEDEEDRHVFVPSRLVLREQEHELRSPEYQLNAFMERVRTVYDDFKLRIDEDCWLELMNDDVMWNLKLQRLINERMLVFFEKHHHLPREVWQLLEACFHWKERVKEDREWFTKRYPHVCRYAVEDHHYMTSLRYSFLEAAESMDYDAFLECREKALIALKDNDLHIAEEMLNKAHAIFSNDPDLLRLQGEYYFRTGQLSRAILAFDQCIRISPDEFDAYNYRARIYYKQEKMTEAIEELEYMLTISPKNLNVLSLQGKCYIKLGQFEQARDCYSRMIEMYPYDIEALVFLADYESSTAKQEISGRFVQSNLIEEPEIRAARAGLSVLSIFKTCIKRLAQLRALVYQAWRK